MKGDRRPADRRDDQGGNPEANWDTPRWREPNVDQGDEEREHRLRDDPSPIERGAIDRENSVGGSSKRGIPGRPRLTRARPPDAPSGHRDS